MITEKSNFEFQHISNTTEIAEALRPGFHLQQTPRPRHKNKTIMCLSSHPSH